MSSDSPLDETEHTNFQSHSTFFNKFKNTITTKDGWIGDYDYKTLCLPRIPCFPKSLASSRSIFFGLHSRIPILVAILMGFQHALAMVGGIITVPRILAGKGDGNLFLDPADQAYLISTALIVSGFMSFIQIIRIKLIKGYWIGTGLISMSGISFTFFPIAQATFRSLYEEGLCEPKTPCPAAYGKWLGTIMIGALLEIALSFIPPKALRRIFPPIVTGITVLLIGASLIPVGLSYWAGGAGPCLNYKLIESVGGNPSSLEIFKDCPNIFGPGDRHYPWGSAQWIGLGFFVFVIIILVEIFGSPFLRNTQVMIGLISGIILSAALGYIDKNLIDQAPWITFPLVRRFPLGFYGPAIIPVLIGYAVSAVETVGDITATAEASRVETEGEVFESRVQGGLLADGINSLIAALLTSSPTTTFSQNNGVIVMTRTANKYAGICAAFWLIFMGLIGKIGGVFVAIPDAVLGGMTIFLFANVAVSGIRILSGLGWNRRDRFILAISLSVGLGVVCVPNAFSFFIRSARNETADSLRRGVQLILSSGYTIGAILAVFLNIVLPEEPPELTPEDYAVSKQSIVDETVEEGLARSE